MPSKNMHVSLRPCLLPGYKKSFTPTRGGLKAQNFCCPDHQEKFNRLARKVGRKVLPMLQTLKEILKEIEA